MRELTYQEVASRGKQVRSGDRIELSTVIASGASVSDVLDLTGGAPVGLIIHTAWTAADVGFNGSMNGANFFPIVDITGEEIIIEGAEAELLYVLPMASLLACKYLQIVSLDSSDGSAENQGAARTITVITLP